jgi:peroxiredoxin
MTTAHSFSFTSIEGKPLPMSTFKGKAVLVVNTASECGLTPQYKGLEALWKSRKDKGLVVLGVPSNDFGSQEPGSETQIKAFCETRYGVDFPLTSKERQGAWRRCGATLEFSQISDRQGWIDCRHLRVAHRTRRAGVGASDRRGAEKLNAAELFRRRQFERRRSVRT